MTKIDLRVYKKELRTRMRALRREMPPEETARKQERIYQRLISLEEYKRARTLVVYVSKELEVDTWKLMRHALAQGKRLAVPRCVENTRIMNMHFIRSLSQLEEGSYGILEPPANAPILRRTRDALCIVPAFCNDLRGYRIGYGGGYYDRYLSSFRGVTVGVNFSDCVQKRLLNGRYDVPIQMLVTDRKLYRFAPPAPNPCRRREFTPEHPPKKTEGKFPPPKGQNRFPKKTGKNPRG